MIGGGNGSHYDASEASHRALEYIRQELGRHPAVEVAQGFPEGVHTQVIAQLDSNHESVSSTDATLTVGWFHGETPDDPPEFSFHYSNELSRDFGWHHEPNPHVEGWGNFQERLNPRTDYTYSKYGFSSLSPSRVVWELMAKLLEKLDTE